MLVWHDPTYSCLIVKYDDSKVKGARGAGAADGLGANNVNIMAMLPNSKLR